MTGALRFAVAVAASLLLVPHLAECQAGQGAAAPTVTASSTLVATGEAELTVKNLAVDFNVPESPAFTAIGLSPETITRPSTPREFATALLNGVDTNGHLQTGVAIDVAPFLIYAANNVTLRDYRASVVTQILSRTMTSFATTKGATEDDKSVKLAIGVHATLYDSEDPRLRDGLFDCFAAIPVFRPGQLPVSPDPNIRGEQERALEQERLTFENGVLKPAAEACQTRFRRNARWNGTNVVVALAPTWVSPTGATSDLDSGTFSAWTSFSYGFGDVPGLRDVAQLTGHIRRLSNELVTDADLPGGSEVRDSSIFGLRLRAGTTGFGLSFEAAYVKTSAAGRDDDTLSRLAFVAERRLADNAWLTVSVGGDRGADVPTRQGMTVLSALRFGLSKDPTLTDEQLRKLMAAR
jgi:hypothetical protein